MNRWMVPSASIVVVAAATASVTFLVPALQAPVEQLPTDDARLSVVCPAVTSATADVQVAATATGAGLRTASLSEIATPRDQSGVVVLTTPEGPQVVSGLRSTTFGAVSLVSAADGPERGLSAATCAAPATEQWFAGVGMNDDAQAELVLTNIDNVDAVADVTVYGDQGRISAPGVRGIVVPAASSRTLPLSVVAASATPVTLQVVTGQGRVAASLRQRLWDGGTPLGADWVPSSVVPVEQVVIPGIPDGDGARQLVITNPGERTTGVQASLLTQDGRTLLPGLENIELPAGTTRSFDVTEALGGQAAALSLVADYPVTASLQASSPGRAERSDPVWVAAQPPVGADGVWLIPAAEKSTAFVQLANPSEAEVRAAITFDGAAQPVEVMVPAGGITRTRVPATQTAVVRLEQAGDVLRGALLVREDLDRVRGLAAIPLVTSESALVIPTATFDPHAG